MAFSTIPQITIYFKFQALEYFRQCSGYCGVYADSFSKLRPSFFCFSIWAADDLCLVSSLEFALVPGELCYSRLHPWVKEARTQWLVQMGVGGPGLCALIRDIPQEPFQCIPDSCPSSGEFHRTVLGSVWTLGFISDP